jgi:tRNA threonylcarbamoyladenosine biosynthesis protein TsaB
MTILCIETSTSVCSAAICKDGALIKQCINYEGSNHARLLPLYIDELLRLAREQDLTIDAVALSEGPGSYTGLRIGASTAKGLCYGLNVPLIPVPTLEVLNIASGIKEGVLLPMIDARRMEIYTAVMGYGLPVTGARAVVVENEDSLLNGEWLMVNGERDVYYFGDGAEKCSKVFTKPNWHLVPSIVPEARFVGVLAENQKSKIENQKSIDLAYYEPFYLKEFIAAQSHVKGLL